MFVYLAPVSRKGEIGKDRTSQPEVVRVPAAVRAAEGLPAGPPSVSAIAAAVVFVIGVSVPAGLETLLLTSLVQAVEYAFACGRC